MSDMQRFRDEASLSGAALSEAFLSKSGSKLLSVIMPVYNSEQTLRRAVSSVLSQSYGGLELILVDDGSTDGSRDICRELSEAHENVLAIRKENGGPASARNRGLRAAQGAYIAFVDADDKLEPEMYEILIRDMEAAGADIAACGFDSNVQTGSEARVLTSPELNGQSEPEILEGRDSLLSELTRPRSCVGWSLWNKVYKAELLKGTDENAVFFREELRINEDLEFNLRLFQRARRLCFRKESLYHYSRELPGLSKTMSSDQYIRAMEAIAAMLQDKELQLPAEAVKNLGTELLNQGLMAAETELLVTGLRDGKSLNRIMKLMSSILDRDSSAASGLRTDQRPLLSALMKSKGLYKALYYAELPAKLMLGGGEIYKRAKASGSDR